MNVELLSRLRDHGALRSVDAALADFVLRKHPAADEEVRHAVALAAALASRAVIGGHSGFRLDAVEAVLDSASMVATSSEANAVDQAAAALAELPEASHWHAALMDSAWVHDDPAATALLCLDQDLLQLRAWALYEQRLAQALLARRSATQLPASRIDTALATSFDAQQTHDAAPLAAARIALQSRLLILCGGPGTGKTHTVLRLLAALVAADPDLQRIHLAAPTGKAASRLDDSLRQRLPAVDQDGRIRAALAGSTQTLHRLLGLRPGANAARQHAQRPLPTDLLVVDEVSMVDLPLMLRVLDALPPHARLLLIGDADQLASVETGDVLSALTQAAEAGGPLQAHAVTLRHNHRFGSDSLIGRLAEAVRLGDGIAARQHLSASDHVCWQTIDAASPAKLTRAVQASLALHDKLCAASDPEQALCAMDAYRVLCALRRGPLGADAVGGLIDARCRAEAGGVSGEHYRGRLVLIRENNRALQLNNGDTGVLLADAEGRLQVWFRAANGHPRALSPAQLPQHQPAWALTVHQSQGSEFDAVDIVLGAQDSRALGRQLLYTAITRARQSLCILASDVALDAAIQRRLRRESGLLRRLCNAAASMT